VTDPISAAQTERDGVLADAQEAAEQAGAWRERRNSLIIQASALNISHRRIASYVGLSDVAVGKIVARERGSADVGSGGSET
jgi:CRP-like cAMP-binding protein